MYDLSYISLYFIFVKWNSYTPYMAPYMFLMLENNYSFTRYLHNEQIIANHIGSVLSKSCIHCLWYVALQCDRMQRQTSLALGLVRHLSHLFLIRRPIFTKLSCAKWSSFFLSAMTFSSFFRIVASIFSFLRCSIEAFRLIDASSFSFFLC